MEKVFYRFIIFSILLGAVSANAVELSLIGGFTSANQTISTNQKQNMVTAPKTYSAIGFFISIPTADTWAIKGGLMYAEAGSHQTYNQGGSFYAVDEKVPYVQVPLILTTSFFESMVVLGIGGYFANGTATVSQNVVQDGGSPYTTFGSFSDNHYTYNDYGVVLDAELHLPLGPISHLSTVVMYEIGAQNVSTITNVSQRNTVLLTLIGFGWKF